MAQRSKARHRSTDHGVPTQLPNRRRLRSSLYQYCVVGLPRLARYPLFCGMVVVYLDEYRLQHQIKINRGSRAMSIEIVRATGAPVHRVGGLLATLCFVMTFSLALAPPAMARPVGHFDAFGNWVWEGSDSYTAIAFSDSDWSWGSSWGAATREQAEAIALSECRKRAHDCKAQAWVVNGCLAWATSDGDRIWGTGWADFFDIAEARALGNCRRAGGKNCVIRAHPCSDD
jgi:uncharacterized protein DUF4189